jgi:hypothetical protein
MKNLDKLRELRKFIKVLDLNALHELKKAVQFEIWRKENNARNISPTVQETEKENRPTRRK